MKKTTIIILVCLAILSMTACSSITDLIGDSSSTDSSIETTISSDTSSSDEISSVTNTNYTTSFSNDEIADMFTDRDLEADYDTSEATSVTLSGETVTITEEGVYILSGTISDGQIVVNATDSDKVQLVLNGVSINSNSSAAIYVMSADKVFITTASGTTNTLSTSGEYVTTEEEGVDAVVFCESDITFNGSGTLTINATYGHGIEGKDDVVFTSGTYNITSQNHAINANDSIRITGATFNIDSGKDAFQCENLDDLSKGYIYIASGTFTVTAVSDCFNSSSCLQIDGGTFDLTAGGGYTGVLNSITVGEGSGNTVMVTDTLEYGMKCFKAETMIFNDGVFNLSSYEDTIHCNGDLTINGGEFYILTGDDGIHSDLDLTINGGTIDIEYGYEGIEGENITINDGDISVKVLDDGINAGSSGALYINGGYIYVECQGDGLDSNGDFEMTGGTVVLNVSAIYTQGDSEIDVSGSVSYTGGTITDESGNTIDPTSSSSSSSSMFSPFSFSNRR